MRSPVRKIRKLIALPASERRLLFEAWFCFLGTALRLAVASPKSLLDRPGVRVHPGAGGGGADIEAFVARAVELVELASAAPA